jgi:hypothetical protein
MQILAKLPAFAFLPLCWLAGSAGAADYYVSSAGDDARDGAAPDRSWRSIGRANRHEFRPGDRLLFRGGDEFDGNLAVKLAPAASRSAPFTISSFGRGKAIIQAGDGTGVLVENSGGIVFRDLVVQGKDRRTNTGSGVDVLNSLPGGKRLEHVRIENVEARHFGKYGIAVGGWPADKSQSGFQDVRISDCDASDNAYAGIHVYGVHDYYAKTYAHREVSVVNCVARENPGDPNYLDNHSGNGILLHDVDGGLIDGCTAIGNGALCRAKNGGPVGIWAYSSRKIVIQHCVSVQNRTGGKFDGGGFDFDGGVTESVMQYNYSAENDGAGYLVFDFGAAPFRLADNVIRFNISDNDGRKNGYCGIHVNSAGAPTEQMRIYHNTVFVSATDSTQRPGVLFVHTSKNGQVYNNLLIATGGCRLADIGADQPGLRILGNHYWATDGEFFARDRGHNVRSLTDWRHRGWERLDGQVVGSTGDPVIHTNAEVPKPTHARQRAELKRFKLRPESPLLKSGINLAGPLKLDLGERDFWGERWPAGRSPAVGAHGGAARGSPAK